MRSRTHALFITLPLAVAAVLLAPAVRPAYADDFTIDSNIDGIIPNPYTVNSGSIAPGFNIAVLGYMPGSVGTMTVRSAAGWAIFRSAAAA